MEHKFQIGELVRYKNILPYVGIILEHYEDYGKYKVYWFKHGNYGVNNPEFASAFYLKSYCDEY